MAAFATLLKIPSFNGNYVKSGVLASFNGETGEIQLVKTIKATYDDDRNSNIFQKVLQNSLIPKIDEKAVFVPYREEYKIKDDDGIKLVEMSKQEYEKEFLEQKQIEFLTFTTSSEGENHDDEETFHIIHPNEQDGYIGSSKDPKSFGNIDERMQAFATMNSDPITTIQFLSVLQQQLQCGSISLVKENIEDHLEGLFSDDWIVDEEANSLSYSGRFKFFPNLDDQELEEFKVYQSKGDKIIIYIGEDESDMNNGWYIIKDNQNNDDAVDGVICEVLIALGGTLISSIIQLVSKHVKEYLRKNHKKCNHHVYEENNSELYNSDENNNGYNNAKIEHRKPIHKKVSKNSKNGSKLWAKVFTNIKTK